MIENADKNAAFHKSLAEFDESSKSNQIFFRLWIKHNKESIGEKKENNIIRLPMCFLPYVLNNLEIKEFKICFGLRSTIIYSFGLKMWNIVGIIS